MYTYTGGFRILRFSRYIHLQGVIEINLILYDNYDFDYIYMYIYMKEMYFYFPMKSTTCGVFNRRGKVSLTFE